MTGNHARGLLGRKHDRRKPPRAACVTFIAGVLGSQGAIRPMRACAGLRSACYGVKSVRAQTAAAVCGTLIAGELSTLSQAAHERHQAPCATGFPAAVSFPPPACRPLPPPSASPGYRPPSPSWSGRTRRTWRRAGRSGGTCRRSSGRCYRRWA